MLVRIDLKDDQSKLWCQNYWQQSIWKSYFGRPVLTIRSLKMYQPEVLIEHVRVPAIYNLFILHGIEIGPSHMYNKARVIIEVSEFNRDFIQFLVIDDFISR